jgi:hypothetical protein
MAPILAGILSMLLQNNLPGIAQAVVDKGLEYVQEKTGVELKPEMSAMEIATLRESAIRHDEFRIEQHNKNTADARQMHIAALGQSDQVAKRFVIYLSAFWSVFAAAYIGVITYAPIPQANIRFADTVLGFLLGTVVALVLNFWLGSSDGSQKKNEAIAEALKGKA